MCISGIDLVWKFLGQRITGNHWPNAESFFVKSFIAIICLLGSVYMNELCLDVCASLVLIYKYNDQQDIAPKSDYKTGVSNLLWILCDFVFKAIKLKRQWGFPR